VVIPFYHFGLDSFLFLLPIYCSSTENGGTLESVTEFTDWWDAIIDPFLLEEEAWKYVNVIVSGTKSDLKSDNICIFSQTY